MLCIIKQQTFSSFLLLLLSFAGFVCDTLVPSGALTITYQPAGCNDTSHEGCVAYYSCNEPSLRVSGDVMRICMAKQSNTGSEWTGTELICQSECKKSLLK